MDGSKAQGMWDVMASALDREQGLLAGYKQDVYEYDRKAVGAIWAPESKYLWVVRENGSHLSRLGVCEGATEAESALKSMLAGPAAQRHCMWIIETSEAGDACIKKIDRERALRLCGWRQYELRDGTLKSGGSVVASVEVCKERMAPGVWGCDLKIQTHRSPIRRSDVLAAYQRGVELATKELGLFVKVRSVTVNGDGVDGSAPVYRVELKASEAQPT